MEKEIWKSIPGYEGIYEVSDLGNIKSIKFKKENILKPSIAGGGYYSVSLSKYNKKRTINIHQLVAIAFLNHIPDGKKLVVDHIDNNQFNNRSDNLQLITQRENASKDRKGGSSIYLGVSWYKKSNKWISSIYHGEKLINLGYFTTEQEASEYYQKALISIENGTEIIRKKVVFSSNFKGVCRHRKSNKWISRIKISKKDIYLGIFDSEQEAHEAYQKALLSKITPKTT
jgi:hypothetical protein